MCIKNTRESKYRVDMLKRESIADKRVLITGAATGIGAAMARHFAEHGARVGVHFHQSKDAAENLHRELSADGAQIALFQGELLDKVFRRKLVASFADVWGGIDVLINNAGACYDYKHFSELPESSWDKTMDLNAKVPFCLARDAFNYMKTRAWGRIINISSVSIKFGGANSLHYLASKAALEAVTTGLARAGSAYNILANTIRCGVIDTPMHQRITGYSRERFAERIKMIPLQRPGEPADIARMALFLASDCGDFITGEVFAVAGGE